MDPSAPRTVLAGVAATSCLCGVAAGIYGGLKHDTPTKFLLYSAVNSGVVAATFFSCAPDWTLRALVDSLSTGIREYVVSPVLVLTHPATQYRLRRQRLQRLVGSPAVDEPVALSWTDIRTSHLLDSGISGGLTGSILNAWKRGRHGLVPGMTTGALACTLLQWGFNELNIFRIRYVSAGSTTHSSVDAAQISPAESPAHLTVSAESSVPTR